MVYSKYYSLLILLIFVSVQGCDFIGFEIGNGDTIIRSVDVDDFKEVFLNGNYEVFLEKGEEPKVVIKTDENLQEFIEVESRGRTLAISNLRRLKGSDGIKVFITYVDLEQLVCGGSSKVFSTSPIVANNLNLSMSGAGMFELEVKVDFLEVQFSGAGLIKLEGEAKTQDIRLTGAGSLEAFDLESDDCEVSISGVGGAEVNVRKKLTARISGMGGIEYIGSPEEIRREVSGIGKIKEAR